MSEISSGRKRWCFRGSGGDDDDDDELPPPHENVPADAAAGGGRVPELPSSKRSSLGDAVLPSGTELSSSGSILEMPC